MAFVETERHGQVMVIRMNRPERLPARSAKSFVPAWPRPGVSFETATSSKWPCSLGLAVPFALVRT